MIPNLSIPVDQRAPARDDLSPKEARLLRSQLLASLSDLPQRRFINDVDAEIWVDSVLAQEPARAWWHFERLFGVGGSEIGVFLGHEEGMFHPFTTARKIVESKLLRAPLEQTNGDMRRGTAMEVIAQGLYRDRVKARGGKAREDLMEKMKGYYDPEHPWLVGNPDDMVEENGKVYIVDYKVPMPDQIAHYDHDGIPFYYEAQLHHYRLIAAKCGIKIDGLRLCSLNLKAWDIDERPVTYKQDVTDAIIATGDKFWFDHVMTGKPPATMTLKKTSSISDLVLEKTDLVEFNLEERGSDKSLVMEVSPDGTPVVIQASAEDLKVRVVEGAGLFNAWSQMSLEAENMRSMMQDVIALRLPLHAFPIGMDRVEVGAARLSIKRAWRQEAVLDAIRTKLTDSGMPAENVENLLDSPNFWVPSSYASEKLIELVKMHLGVDIQQDPRFDTAVVAPAQRRVDTLMSLLVELDVDKNFDYAPLLDADHSSVKFELNRDPLSGPFAELKEETRHTLRRAIQPTISQIAREYGEKRGILVEERRRVDAEKAADKARQKEERRERQEAAAQKRQEAAERKQQAQAAAKASPPAPPRRRSRP